MKLGLSSLVSLRPTLYYVGGVCVAIVFSAIAAGSTVFFLRSLNNVVHSEGAGLGEVHVAAGLLLSLATSSYLAQILIFKVTNDFVHDVRMQVVGIVADAPLEKIESFGVEPIITVLTRHIRALVSFFAFIPNAITSSLVIFGCVLYILTIDIFVGMTIGVGMLVIFGLGKRARARAQPEVEQYSLDEQSVRSQLRQLIEGSREVRLNSVRRQRFVAERIPSLSRSAADHDVAAAKVFMLNKEIVSVIQFSFFLAAVIYSSIVGTLGVAGVGAIVVILFYLQGHVGLVNAAWQRATPAWIGYRQIWDLCDDLGRFREAEISPTQIEADWQEIQLHDACFQYPTRAADATPFSVGPVNVTIPRGELIFVTGLNGAGKTTLAKMVSGLYRLTAGNISVDGDVLDDDAIMAYRQLFCVILLKTSQVVRFYST